MLEPGEVMFAYKRTPILALVFGAVIAVVVVLVFEDPARPFTLAQLALFYFISCLPGMGIAMLMDPKPKEMKEKYLQVNFYEDQNPFTSAKATGDSDSSGS